MKTLVALLLSCAAVCCAQEPKTEEVKRLASVTWDLSTHKLIWTVEKGTVAEGEFVPKTKVQYEVSPDDGFMAYAGEKRPIAGEEGEALHHLLNVLSLYCVESVVWWNRGPDATDSPTPGVVTKPAVPDGRPIKMGFQRPMPVRDNQMAALQFSETPYR